MRFRDLPIGLQLFLGLGGLLLLVALLGGVAWRQADLLWAETEGLYEHPLQVRRAVGDIKADVLAMHRSMKDAVLAESEAEIAQALLDMDRYEADAHRQFSILYDRYLGPRDDVAAAERSFTEWRAIRDETIRLLRAGRTAEARLRTTPAGAGGQYVDAILTALQKISDFAAARADQFYADAQSERDRLRVQLATTLVGILLLTVIIGYILLRNILDPLHELTAVAEQQRAGRPEARSRYAAATRNELARLAAAFNALADAVSADLQNRAALGRISDVMLREAELEGFGPALLAALARETDAQVAALYLLNETKTAFEPYAAIGLPPEGRRPFDARAPEGEFGAALATRQIQHLAAIPADTPFRFVAASGDFRPQAILTAPLLAGDEVVAVISLASLRPYSPAAIRLVHDIRDTLNARLNALLTRRQIETFSARLEAQNRELEAQQSELTTQADELTAQNIELEVQKTQLDEANRLKSRFLSNMSHELRTPLNSVIALAGVLSRRLRGIAPEEEYSYLEIIERNGKHLLTLINDILDLSRIEAGREEVVTEAFSVHDLAAEVVEMVAPQAQEKGLALRNETAADLPPLTTDRAKCRHILQNLIANAVKFTDAGQVTVSAAVAGAMMQVVVRDTGIGIAADQLPFIFDEFRQADDSAARRHGGAGLGLAIARRYARLLGGDIAVESAPGRGSTFTLTLPLVWSAPSGAGSDVGAGSEALAGFSGGRVRPANPEGGLRTAAVPEPPTRMPVEAAPPARAGGRRLLLVEDSEPAVIQMRDILAGQGYEIAVARDGRAALAQIAQARPDALILDLMMPEVDGFAVLRALRADPATAALPVLILTARHLTSEELSFLTGNHVQQLIQKGDVSKAELLAAVASLFAPATESPAATAGRPPAPKRERRAGQPIILVVEDNLDNLRTARAVLQDNYRVIEATDGRAGVAQAQAHRPDLILMDIALPVMDGIQALAAIRADPNIRHTPVIALTASAMLGDREEIMAYGFDAYLSKPIDAPELLRTIQEVLDDN